MIHSDIAILRTESARPLGVFETPETRDRTVYCIERNVTDATKWEARSHGVELAVQLKLAAEAEYQGERICIYKNVEYTVDGVKPLSDGGILLTLARKGAGL